MGNIIGTESFYKNQVMYGYSHLHLKKFGEKKPKYFSLSY